MEVGEGGERRVQSISNSGISHVPTQYIQPAQNRPETTLTTTTTTNIPSVDLLNFDLNQRDSIREAIADACREWGAFHVTNHAVSTQLLDQMKNVGLTFFNDCPMAEKLKYACEPNSAASEGYGSKMLISEGNGNNGDVSVLDWRDYFDHHTFPLSRRNPSNWPHFPSSYRETVAKYSDEMKVLAQKLLGLISESLGLTTRRIEEEVGEFYQNITVSYYPPCPQPELTLGLQSHSDFGVITLLIQDDVGGLQVLRDGEWITVHPVSNAIVVILSDQTEIITNGRYKSAQHRAVTNSTRSRLSVATFHDPTRTMKISPVSELVSDTSPPLYREVVYGEYVSAWYIKGPEGKRNIDALLLH